MDGLQMQEKEEEFHVDKASKWTVYFLIDLRVLFIITYVYISVINLISTTANGEASSDADSMALFNVTSHPNHSNVMVSSIDDALLWSCRRHSATKGYYEALYSMLLAAFTVTLIGLFVTKLTILCGNKTGISHLWKIAVVQHLQESEGDHCDSSLAIAYGDLLETDVPIKSDNFNTIKASLSTTKEKETSQMDHINIIRIVNLLISVLLLPVTIFMLFTSYDLHLLSCLIGPNEEYINYASSTRTVEIRYSDDLLQYRRIIMFFVALFVVILFINAVCFYLCNSIIVDHLKTHVKGKRDEVLEKLRQSDDGKEQMSLN